jgi:hypothetical protein
MADTDRTKFKKWLHSILAAVGLGDAWDTVKKINEEVILLEIDADASLAERGFTCVKPFIVKSIDITPSTDLAAHASAYVTYTAQKRPVAALGTPVPVATFDTATGGSNVSLTAWTKKSMTLTSTVSNRKFAAGDVFTFKAAETSTPTSPIGTVAVTVEYI